MSFPSQMKAIKIEADKKASVHTDAPIPDCPDDYILCKVSYVGLNPTDWKGIQYGTPGNTVGVDFSGTVLEIGKSVTKPLQKGDRVAALARGNNTDNPSSGAFCEYAIAKGDLVIKLADAVSDAEAATYGVGCVTIGQGMYQTLELPWPGQGPETPFPVLIYGGSSGMGMFAIQFAKLSGLRVVTTCSPRNFEFVKRLGADAVFDYKDPDCAQKIRDYTNNSCMHCFDCIAEKGSGTICGNGLSSAAGVKYSGLIPGGTKDFTREDAALNTWTLGYTAIGETFKGPGFEVPAKPDDYEFAKKWVAECERLSRERKFVIEPTVREGGLDGVLEGLDDLKNDRVSAQKLVYKVA